MIATASTTATGRTGGKPAEHVRNVALGFRGKPVDNRALSSGSQDDCGLALFDLWSYIFSRSECIADTS